MQATVIGYSEMKGTSKRTGKPYSGVMIHLAYERENVTGNAVHSQFVGDDLITFDIQLGQILDFSFETDFNGYSRLVGVEVVEAFE